MIRPSVGGSLQQPSLGMMPLRKCLNRVEEDNVVLLDEESDSCDNVVVIDGPECLPTKLRGGSERLRRGKKPASSWTSVICLDDDDDDEDICDHFDGDRVKNVGTFKNGSSSSRKSNPWTSGNFGSSSFAKIDQFGQENISPLKLSKGKRTYSGKVPAGNRFGLDDIDDLSCNDVLDCELMEDSGGKEMWEKASSKRKLDQQNGRPAQGDSYKDTYDAHKNVETSTDCGQCKEPPSVPKQAVDEGEASSIHKKKGNLDFTSNISLDDGVESILLDSIVKSRASYGKDDTFYTQGSSFDFAECCGGQFSEPSSSTNIRSTEDQKLKGPSSFPSVVEGTAEQVNDVHKPFHDDTKDPLGDPCISHRGTCAKENVFVSEVNLSQKEPPTSAYNNQSVYSEFGHVRFSPPEQNGRFPKNTNRRTNNAPEMKLRPQPEPFSNTLSSHQHTASVCTRYGNEDRPVSVKTVFNKSSVCIDECIHKDCCRFGMEQLNERASIFHSVQNEEHSANLPNPQDDERNDSMHGDDGEAVHKDEFLMAGDREKLKETDEYKKATEEEWTSRQQALQIQAEEARNQRRLRKRLRAETMRILDVEKRQKKRLEEIRESEKKDQENSNLREIIRAEIRKDLYKLEVTCYDMASLLQGLGISIGGRSLPPLLSEVRAAYKRALLAFHPDRASRSDVRKQVEAEEKFKLICRMKEKYLPS